MENLESLLDEFDKSVKRLALPSALVAAAVLLSSGALKTEAGFMSVAVQVSVLGFSAIVLYISSIAVTIAKVSKYIKSNWLGGAIGAAYTCCYIVLAIVGIFIAAGQFI